MIDLLKSQTRVYIDGSVRDRAAAQVVEKKKLLVKNCLCRRKIQF